MPYLALFTILSLFIPTPCVYSLLSTKDLLASENIQSHYLDVEGQKYHYLTDSSSSSQALVFLPGMAEPAMKYIEVARNLQALLGYKIYVWDHPGQGLSQEVVPNLDPHKVHIPSFSDYIGPLEKFFKMVESQSESVFVVASSMGGHILLRSLIEKKVKVDKLVLISPMVDIKTYGIPYETLAWGLSQAYKKTDWGPLQSKAIIHYEKFFHWKQSPHRRRVYEGHLAANPQIKRDGATAGWFLAAIASIQKLHQFNQWQNVQVPTLMLLAGNDLVVESASAEALCKKMPRCQAEVLPESLHEIFMEVDSIYQSALQKIRGFLAQSDRNYLGS